MDIDFEYNYVQMFVCVCVDNANLTKLVSLRKSDLFLFIILVVSIRDSAVDSVILLTAM